MITKTKQADGLWRYRCDECHTTHICGFPDLKNPCRCPIQPIVELAAGEQPPAAAPQGHRRKWRVGSPVKKKCKHLGQRRSANGEEEILKVLCETCQGSGNVNQPVFSCDVHKRCLPHFRPQGEAYDRWYGNEAKGIERRFEADFYHVCHGCSEKELVEISLPAPDPLLYEPAKSPPQGPPS